MNQLPCEIQKIVYRYIHADALQLGFAEIFPITSLSSPFSMDIVSFNETPHGRIWECTRFKSEMCRMCYSRNIDDNRPFDVWIRCYDILDGIDDFSFINGEMYHYKYKRNDGLPALKLMYMPETANIDTSKGCLFKQAYDLYEFCLRNPELEDLQNYHPLG